MIGKPDKKRCLDCKMRVCWQCGAFYNSYTRRGKKCDVCKQKNKKERKNKFKN